MQQLIANELRKLILKTLIDEINEIDDMNDKFSTKYSNWFHRKEQMLFKLPNKIFFSFKFQKMLYLCNRH